MHPVRVLIVDDEALSRQRIRRLLSAEEGIEIVDEADGGISALALIREHHPDIVTLDIQMPDLDGFGVLRALEESERPCVLFVTAYDEYALDAFDVHAIDYVLKPVDAERFRRAFTRARRSLELRSTASRYTELLNAVSQVLTASPTTSTTTSAEQRFASRLLVRRDGRMYFVPATTVDWIEADRNYIRLHVGQETHVLRERIGRVLTTLDPRTFARIHRSTIVNLNRVREMQPWFSGDYVVILNDGTRLRMSRHYRESVEQQIAR